MDCWLCRYPDASFDVVVDKGMSDTLQFRSKNQEQKALLLQMFTAVHRVLVPRGKFWIFTPKPRVRRLSLLPLLPAAVSKRFHVMLVLPLSL